MGRLLDFAFLGILYMDFCEQFSITCTGVVKIQWFKVSLFGLNSYICNPKVYSSSSGCLGGMARTDHFRGGSWGGKVKDLGNCINFETMISVIVPLYNKEKSIKDTIQTVLSQSYQDFEIVVVNDGSTDRSVQQLKTISDARIRLFEQENTGVSAARNRGIAEAHGEFVAFLDADDRWKPDYLQTQHALTIKYPDCSVFATAYEIYDVLGHVNIPTLNRLTFSGDDGILTNYFEVATYSNPPLWTSAVMVRREAILEVGGFPKGIGSGEDLLTWARLAARFGVAYTRVPKAEYILQPGHDYGDIKKRLEMKWPDYVGDELRTIAHIVGKRDEGWHYLATWYKLRANKYYRGRNRQASFVFSLRAIRYWPMNFSNWCYLFFNFLPLRWVKRIMKW